MGPACATRGPAPRSGQTAPHPRHHIHRAALTTGPELVTSSRFSGNAGRSRCPPPPGCSCRTALPLCSPDSRPDFAASTSSVCWQSLHRLHSSASGIGKDSCQMCTAGTQGIDNCVRMPGKGLHGAVPPDYPSASNAAISESPRWPAVFALAQPRKMHCCTVFRGCGRAYGRRRLFTIYSVSCVGHPEVNAKGGTAAPVSGVTPLH